MVGEHDHVAGGDLLLRIVLSPGVAEAQMVEAELVRALVHHRDEIRFRPGDSLGEHDGRIIAGIDDEPADQVFDSDLAAERGKHRRSV